MKKFFWIIILALAAVFAAAGVLVWREAISARNVSPYGNEIKIISVAGQKFEAEIVNTPEKEELGLSGRDDLCRNCAMLFELQRKSVYPFWMKDMRFDLDMLWIEDDTVVAVKKNVSHEGGMRQVANPGVLADKVLEINAGLSDALGIKVGDKILFDGT